MPPAVTMPPVTPPVSVAVAVAPKPAPLVSVMTTVGAALYDEPGCPRFTPRIAPVASTFTAAVEAPSPEEMTTVGGT